MARLNEQETKEDLELFKAEAFLPELKPSQEVQEFLQNLANTKYLRDLESLDLQEKAVQLAHYAAYLTSQENRLRSYINYCEANLRVIVGQKMSEAWGFTFPEKDLYIRTHDENAMELQAKKDTYQVKLDYIQFMANKLSQINDTIKGLCFEKHRASKL